MCIRLLQANLNHARQAQDLFPHVLAEHDFGLGIAAEPYMIPQNYPCWMGDLTGTVAITWREATNSSPCNPVRMGKQFVAVN